MNQGGNIEWIKNKLGGQNISLIGEDWFNDLVSKTKTKFSSKQIPQFTDKDVGTKQRGKYGVLFFLTGFSLTISPLKCMSVQRADSHRTA